MKLHFHPLSQNSRRARMVAHELGLPIELSLIDLMKGENRTPEFAAKNANTKVPVLEDGDFCLNESYAIMLYLVDVHGASSLYPAAPKARADVNRWLFWCSSEFGGPIQTLNFENMLKGLFGMGPADPARVAEAGASVKRLAGILDAHLAGRTWVCGDTFTLADIALACTLQTTVPAQLPVLEFASLQAWFKRVQERASWAATQPG